LRPVPELGACLAYTPFAPRLHQLNPTAWLILELAEDREVEAIAEEFAARTAPQLSPAQARRTLEAGLADLLASGLVQQRDDAVLQKGIQND
jgi:hypothetical protein